MRSHSKLDVLYYNGLVKPKCSDNNPSHCHFVHHKSHTNWHWNTAFSVRGWRLTALVIVQSKRMF